MKKTFIHLFVFAGLTLATAWGVEGRQVIVDTKFDQIENAARFRVVPETAEEPPLPITVPTRVSVRGTMTISAARNGVAGVKPPFALFKGTADPKVGGEIYWDLRGLRFTSGKFALACQVTPQDANVDGLTLQIVAAGADGQWIWPQKRPLCINYTPHEITTDETGSEKILYTAGTTSTLLIEFDLGALTWRASVDGTPLLQPTSFKQLFDPGTGLMVGGIFLRMHSGQSVAVANVKFEKLAGSSPPAPALSAGEKIPRIAWVGDSITQGYGLGNGVAKSPPGVLRTLLKGEALVGNFGISGTTLLKNGDSPYWRQAALIRAKRFTPTSVIIMLGTNDSKPQNWAHASEIAGDMAALVAEFKNLPSRPEVVVVMPVPVVKSNFGITEELLAQVRPLLAQGAKQAGAVIVESAAALADQAALFPDGVHPNEKGAELIAQLVARNLPSLKK